MLFKWFKNFVKYLSSNVLTGYIFQNPYDLMMVYSALIDAPDMAKFFWENSRTPIATSLIAHKVRKL